MTAEFTAGLPTQIPAKLPARSVSQSADSVLGKVPIARTAKMLLAEGIEAARQRELERAIALFTQSLSLTSDDLAIHLKGYYHRGCALSGVGWYGEAIADFTQVIQFSQSDRSKPAAAVPTAKLAEIYIHRGNAYRYAGQYSLAVADLNSGIERSGGSAQSYGARGLLRLDMDEFDGAIADFTHALKVHPTFAQCHLWRGFARLRSGNFQQAAGDLSRAIEAIPACAEAYNHRGIACFYLNEFAAASADFNQAIRLNPKFAEAYNNRGNLRQLTGELAEARADYSRAIALDPLPAELYFNRAAAVSLEPSSLANNLAGNLANNLADNLANNLADIAADYDTTAGLSLSSAAFYRHRAQIRLHQGRPSAAAADYTQALAMSPNAYAYYHRGLAYVALGKFDQAHSDFDAAIALSPDYGAVYGDRAQLRFKLGDLAGAIADTEQSLALTDSHGQQLKDTYATRCLIFFCAGKSAQALQDFEKLIALIARSVQTAQSSSHTSKESTSIGST